VVDRVKELIKYKGLQIAPPSWRPGKILRRVVMKRDR
jgi:hypothetical protein